MPCLTFLLSWHLSTSSAEAVPVSVQCIPIATSLTFEVLVNGKTVNGHTISSLPGCIRFDLKTALLIVLLAGHLSRKW